tara:strand:+ start:1565 stop:1714 length:150 start_codon:yes stop_codon:yes gene_type:complete
VAVKKEKLKRGPGFFKQQHEENAEGMKKKKRKAGIERNKTLRRKKNVLS